MRTLLALSLCLPALLAGCLDAADAPAPAGSPYAGLESREIKALSEQDVADLRAGAGRGYSLAAELNRHPGPLHVLELAEELGLSDEQRAEVQRLREDVVARAVVLGEALLRAEADLEEAFRRGDLDAARLEALVLAAAEAEGRLRFAHLEAHLATTAQLNEHQVRTYDALRGYGARDGGPHAHDPSHGGH